MAFQKLQLQELTINPFTKIGKDWFLVTSGTPEHYNTMTASWGQMGELWGRPVFTSYIRSNRHTYTFVEENDLLTFSFFDAAQHAALQFCGTHSGRDCDKAKETGLHARGLDGSTTFAEASLVFVCKKLYHAPLSLDAADEKAILTFYEKDPMHTMYVTEILAAYQQEA